MNFYKIWVKAAYNKFNIFNNYFLRRIKLKVLKWWRFHSIFTEINKLKGNILTEIRFSPSSIKKNCKRSYNVSKNI